MAALVDGEERDFSYILEQDCDIEPILGDTEAGRYILRHSCAHLLAQAVVEIYPDAQPTIGPPIENGFYYDFKMDPVGDGDLKKIEKKMQEHIRANHTLTREEHDNRTLRDLFAGNPFKIEIMNERIGMEIGSSA